MACQLSIHRLLTAASAVATSDVNVLQSTLTVCMVMGWNKKEGF